MRGLWESEVVDGLLGDLMSVSFPWTLLLSKLRSQPPRLSIVWAERAAASNASNSAHAPQAAEGKVLERLDRRKRRRTRQPEDIAMRDEGESSAEVSREEERNEYRYHS